MTSVERAPGPIVAGAYTLVSSFGCTKPWARIFMASLTGTETDRGLVALIAGLTAAGICGLRAFSTVRDRYYYGVGFALAAVTLVMTITFISDVEGSKGPVESSGGVWLAAGAMGYAVSLLWQFLRGTSTRSIACGSCGVPAASTDRFCGNCGAWVAR